MYEHALNEINKEHEYPHISSGQVSPPYELEKQNTLFWGIFQFQSCRQSIIVLYPSSANGGTKPGSVDIVLTPCDLFLEV